MGGSKGNRLCDMGSSRSARLNKPSEILVLFAPHHHKQADEHTYTLLVNLFKFESGKIRQ